MTRVRDILSTRIDGEDISAYECGDMDEQEEIVFFQDLINTGQAWLLQGSYGRTAMDYIDAGLCMLGEVGQRDYWGNYVPSRYEVEPGTKGSKEYCEKMQHYRAAA